MCLYVLDTNKKPLIAQEDITVYKRLERTGKGEYQSPYLGSYYERGQLYTSKIGKLKAPKSQYPKTFKDHNMNRKVTTIGYIDEGIHAYTSRATAKSQSEECWSWNEESIITCVIPKGSQYYLGSGNEIVTNQLFIGTKIK